MRTNKSPNLSTLLHPTDALASVFIDGRNRRERDIANSEVLLAKIKSGKAENPFPDKDPDSLHQHQIEFNEWQNSFEAARLELLHKLYGIFGERSVFIPIWERSKKPKISKWSKTRFPDTCYPEFASLLRDGNISILQGSPSDHLVSIDVDSDNDFRNFLALNPKFSQTTLTRGQRGGNVWIRIDGDYPDLVKVERRTFSNEGWGEFRSTGGHTVVSGIHPNGPDYVLDEGSCENKILRCSYADIVWPEEVFPPHERTVRKKQASTNQPKTKTHPKKRSYNTRSTETQVLKASFDLQQYVEGMGYPWQVSGDGIMICCPFHDDHNPSCWVHEDRFQCFSCKERGDSITFVMKVNRMNFKTAVALIDDLVSRTLCTTHQHTPSLVHVP